MIPRLSKAPWKRLHGKGYAGTYKKDHHPDDICFSHIMLILQHIDLNIAALLNFSNKLRLD